MKDKYLQIFRYLLEFSKIRSKAVRNIENAKTNYIDILWMSDLPENELIECIVNENFSTDSDFWLKISKPKEPEKLKFPSPPQKLKDWIKSDSLLNKNEFPVLLTEIADENGKTKHLDDNHQIKLLFDNYCENKWFSDSDVFWKNYEIYEKEFAAYEKINAIYKQLFSIYNKSQQFGEEYELIMGVGLIHFRENENTPLVCRHIITSKAEINFEYSQKDSRLIVKQSISDGLQIETDAIIDLFEQFDSNDILEAEKKSIELIKEKELVNPFDDDIHDVLQLLAERIKPGDGNYKDDLGRAKDVPSKETIFFSPALILRKRNTRSYTALYEKIISDIENEDEIKIPILDDLIELKNTDSNSSVSNTNNAELNETETIYFPKKYNDEQIAIINKARCNNKVLVQGPPGTGKSHTIANLICHLLANGKKVLVTAYTKRALEVLKDKLPDDFKNLTVNLLSGDSSSINDLEASVNTINDELSNTDIESLKTKIEKLESELSSLKENRAKNTNELLKIKENSSRRFEINSAYSGTLTEITEKLEKEKEKHEWYKDDFDDINNNEIIHHVEKYSFLLNHYSNIDCSIFDYKLPDKQKLFEISDFRKFQLLDLKANGSDVSKETIASVKSIDFDLLQVYLAELKIVFEKIDINPHPFKKEIINDILNYQKRKWQNKIDCSKTVLSDLEKYNLKLIDRNVEIKYPKDKSLITLKNDAKVLLGFLDAGSSLSGIGFKLKKAFLPTEIKEKLYFLDLVLVNDSPCNTKDEFNYVLDDIRIKQNFEEINDAWENADKTSRSFNDKFVFYQKLYKDTLALFENIALAEEKISSIKSVSNIFIDSFNIANLNQIIKNVSDSLVLNQIAEFEQKRNQIIRYLSEDNLHSITSEIAKAFMALDIESYKILLNRLKTLQNDKLMFASFKNLENELMASLPILIEEINNNVSFTQSNINLLENAISFKHANFETNRLLSEDYEKKLIELLKSYDSKEESLIAQIAANKSWVFVLENLQKNRSLRQHLQAWVQAVKKIGKTGRGKRALKFRKIAQEEMEYCKTSIPCWIMPLYKVTETIQPEQGIYDYVITDEASQLGPDAIFLLYISKNIIIVGDDKQTSPEYIGVDANTMVPFINKHLQGIPFKDFYGTETSFFDVAKIFCEGITVLREHFRCMPEIIEFSNKLFYAPDGKGLYPLKQYSENRLEPLMHVYCQNGYIEGSRQSIRNEPEAVTLVNKIAEIVKDDRYLKKTIGVICLQGNAQSALIESLLVKEIGEKEFKERKIICGNSASFQGDERDIIFLSLVTAQNHNRSALARPEDEKRFNVAASRAVEQMWLFHSILLADLSNTNDLRYKLLNHFINYRPPTPPASDPIERTLGNQPEPFDSWFEVDIYNDIVAKGYSVIPQYEVAKGKYRIDLVAIFHDGTKLAIECDGDKWHGADQYQNDLMRQKVLERCGWQFFRIRGGDYYSNREKALVPLWEIFDKKPIKDTEPIEEKDKNLEIDDSNIGDNIKKEFDDNSELTEDVINNIKTSDLDSLFNQREFLVFTDQFNVYKNLNKGFISLQQVTSNIEFKEDEKIIYITSTTDYSGYMLFGFENGKVAKIYMQSYRTLTKRKRLKNAYNSNSKLVFIDYTETDIHLAVISSIYKVIVFNTNQINPKESKGAQGNQVIKSKNNSVMREIKKTNQVTFENIEYYNKNIPAAGNYLLPQDDF
ncbi:MAG: AAA domain-containing protein [bacterium]|nr:AAA domain-containing protein [bacterium]